MPACLRPATLALVGLVATTPLAAQRLAYPAAPPGEVVDRYGGRQVADPYRWLEQLDSPATRQWLEAENRLTFGYLASLPQRDSIRQRLTRLWDYPRTGVPIREAGQLFFRRNSGLQRQSVLYRQDTPTSRPFPVLDPNELSSDGSLAVADWAVSPDGRTVAYTTAEGGSDLQDIRLRDLGTGRDLPEVIPRVKFSGISWTRDGTGFYFSRFRGSAAGANLHDANTHHQLWYHPVGAGQERLIFQRPDDSTAWVNGQVSDDGRWLYLTSGSGTTNNRLWVADLKSSAKPDLTAVPSPMAVAEDAIYTPLGVVGTTLYLYTNYQAPRGRIVSAIVGEAERTRWRTVVPEASEVISEAILVGNWLVVSYLVDVQSRIRVFDLQGRPRSQVPLPGVGTASGLRGRNDATDFFFAFSSYLHPAIVYRYDLPTDRMEPFGESVNAFNSSRYETRAVFYNSKDGTRVPLFITAAKGLALDGSHPTLLYGYGGFDVNIMPDYSPAAAAWLELGGVYAVANLRGGGEYGETWHRAGMRDRKQNVFDDFIGAAEYLIHQGYTTPTRLAIEGRSNGGLLVGAVMTQRPDLFAVALPAVGVMDMLRYQKFTGGQLWADDYGSSEDPTAAEYLLAYSPLHNLKSGTCYPATLVTTADHDDRVVPSHSYKFTAALQAAQGCARPALIRVETEGSHGYRPTNRVIAEIADEFAFALANLGHPAP
jgi:prolyl oligopeptidase